jgi:tripeptide aminopeptidase
MRSLPTVVQRFLRYVVIDTQSDGEATCRPTTAKQKNLGRLLESELRELGLADVELAEDGVVYGTLPATPGCETVPVLGFLAHQDTSPDASGENVKPQIHQRYDGGTLRLPSGITITLEDDPELASAKGHTLITSDGSTLLGADDKAGIAEIMTALDILRSQPHVPHGKLRVAFTVDEEVGTGTKGFDLKYFGADYAYTVDGGGVPGEFETETFSGDGATVEFVGRIVHPGVAKGKMLSALKTACDFVASLPPELTPETTEGREGFVHPTAIKGGVDQASVKFLLRSFDAADLVAYKALLERLAAEAAARRPGVQWKVTTSESYRNMGEVLKRFPESVEAIEEAIRRVQLTPVRSVIRGGTDGSVLSARGLPTPNIFTGGHLYHSCREWISVQVMEKAVETILALVAVWTERRR